MKKLLTILTLHALFINAQVTRVWTGDGSGNNWNTPANWSGSAIPTSNDTVVFNNTSSKNCIINVNVNVARFIIQNGYSGTITQNNNRSVAVATDFIMSGGTFSPASGTSTGSFTVQNGDFVLNQGSFTKSTSNMTINSGNFIVNGGTYNKGSAGALTISSGDLIINSGTFNMGSGGNLSVSIGNIVLNGGNFVKTKVV